MIARYSRPEMARLWADENRFRKWLEVELAAAEVEAELGMIPDSAAKTLRARAGFDLERIRDLEAETRHDVIAFTTAVAERVGTDAAGRDASRFLHFGLTSNDVVDTAQALLLRDAAALLAAGLEKLAAVLKRRALEFRRAPMIGRTHGVHAEPITFGLKWAIWYAENQRNRRRLAAAAEDLRVGKISGAVGTYAHLGPDVEARICARLGLAAAPISSQVLQRDRHAMFLCALAVIASSFDKIALEIRHLQRTEVREAEEYFAAGQKGSSAMPHKRNPVTCEQICGLARVVRGNAQAGLEDVALWHERDISHSSVERVVLPDSTTLVDYMAAKLTDILDRLLVYPERMRANLEMTRGLVFSGQLLLDLAEAGLTREEAYALTQRHAMEAWRTGGDFRAAVLADPAVAGRVPPKALEKTFDLERHLRHVDAILERALAE